MLFQKSIRSQVIKKVEKLIDEAQKCYEKEVVTIWKEYEHGVTELQKIRAAREADSFDNHLQKVLGKFL